MIDMGLLSACNSSIALPSSAFIARTCTAGGVLCSVMASAMRCAASAGIPAAASLSSPTCQPSASAFAANAPTSATVEARGIRPIATATSSYGTPTLKYAEGLPMKRL